MTLDRYKISLICCVGIAGSLSDDMRLGDVCHSSTIIDVLDNAKFSDTTDGADGVNVELSPKHYETHRAILTHMNFIRTQPNLKAAYLAWQADRATIAQAVITSEVPTPSGGMFRLGEPSSKSGAIACGAVSKSAAYNAKLRAIDRSILAIETETGGIFLKAKDNNVPVMTVRGISDYADREKKKLEIASKGAVRHLAAGNAASFLRLQISENEYFRVGLKKLSKVSQPELILTERGQIYDPVSAIINDAYIVIDENLRKFSPEYRIQEKGYRLPTPRVRLTGNDESTPIEVRDAVKNHDRVIINLPRTYPDQSLSWVIANDLCGADIDGQQPVPFVINGDGIRGRATTLASLCGPGLSEMVKTVGVMPVVIVENIPFSSKHRREMLVEEAANYPGVKFVFLVRGEADLVSETEFSAKTASEIYETCPISFKEIALFVQKNFQMSGSESEVVALRLRETFNRFDLDAHPTYFAGIPRETLSALLQANRRSELIQLAVDGFLTFVVAGDKGDVALSRTTRARFLRQLVVDMHVEHHTYDEPGLLKRIKDFAAQHDFDIDPMRFMQGFIDHGIMHFENGNAKISLPFIESYLLADELSRNPAKANKYFDVNSETFDFATLDLYSEIGPSPDLVIKIIETLKTSLELSALRTNEPNILIGGSILPNYVKQPERGNVLQRRLAGAHKAVRENSENAGEKQKTLDLADRIKEKTGRVARERKPEEDQHLKDLEPLKELMHKWCIATILLGSSAEHLDAGTKRGLAQDIVVGASRLIDEWSRFQAKFDFDELRRELTTDEALADLPGPQDLEEKRKFTEILLDIIEYSALAKPLRKILGFLCEQARQKVLAPSIAAVVLEGPLENVIHGTWLTDVDSKRGAIPLRDSLRGLPRSTTFLRITLMSHYLARVYWNHWSTEHRLALLEAASEAIKPLGATIEKAKITRLVKRQPN